MTRNSASSTRYQEVTLSSGYTVKVYPVPQTLLWQIKPKTGRPKVPVHEMKTATGSQDRPSKPGDPEWASYLQQRELWEEERNDLEISLRLVLGLQDFVYPDDLSPSPMIQQMIDSGMLDWPENPLLQKAQWLRENVVLSANDSMLLQEAGMQLSGVDQEVVDGFRESFRRGLLESYSNRVETEDTEVEGDDEPVRTRSPRRPRKRRN